MKNAISILTLLFVLESIFTSESLRNLEDEIDSTNIMGASPDTNSPSYPVPANSSVANKPKQINKNNAPLQIKKFHNFDRPSSDKIVFSVFFYYLNKIIVETIIMRVKIVYGGRILRNMETSIEAESAKAECIIKEKYKNKIGVNGTGDNIDYECTSSTMSSASVQNVTLDTDFPLIVGGEEIDFNDVNFDEEAAKESVNLVKITKYDIIGTLDNSKVDWGASNFKIIGTPLFVTQPTKGKKIQMQFINYSENKKGTKIIDCSIADISSSQCTLNCDGALSIYISEIPLTKSLDNNVLLMINLDKNIEETGKLVGTTGDSVVSTNTPKKKSSSGLSAGAIAGIVVGAVVVLLGISIIAIICCRKSKQLPIDNTTAIDVKTTERIYI